MVFPNVKIGRQTKSIVFLLSAILVAADGAWGAHKRANARRHHRESAAIHNTVAPQKIEPSALPVSPQEVAPFPKSWTHFQWLSGLAIFGFILWAIQRKRRAGPPPTPLYEINTRSWKSRRE